MAVGRAGGEPGGEAVPVRGDGVPIWDYLYAGGEQHEGVREQLRQKHEEHLRALANQCHTKPTSQQAVADRKRRRARHIFELLDRGSTARRGVRTARAEQRERERE